MNFHWTQFSWTTKLYVKAVNDTMGDKGLVSFCLVFGTLPRFSILSTNLQQQKAKLVAMKTAKAKMYSILAQRRLSEALHNRNPLQADRVYRIREDVVMYSENKKERLEPCRTVEVNSKMVNIYIQEETYKSYNFCLVMRF